MSRGGASSRTRSPTPTLPRLPHPFEMTYRDGLFAHWPIDPDRLRPHVPPSLELDVREGRAWLSVLPFVLARAGLRGSPSFARLTVPECNVRTYVRYGGDPGLYFFSIDVDSALVPAVVGGLSPLPVFRATMHVGGHDERVAFSSSRPADGRQAARFAATYRPDGPVSYPEPGSLARWLVERRRLYAPRDGDVLTAEIGHAPWPLQPAAATISENTLFEAAGLPTPDGEPTVHYCDELGMTGSVPRRVRASGRREGGQPSTPTRSKGWPLPWSAAWA